MLSRKFRLLLNLGLFLVLLGSLAPASLWAVQDPFADFPQRVEAARKQWGAPGLAIAVVHNDKVVLASGFGVRDISTGKPVDENTLFHVGSTTKAFTAAAAGLLVEEGRLAWTDRVIDHLPEFRVADPYVTRELTVLDLLTHRSGVQGTDLLWVTGLRADQFLPRFAFAEQSSSLRSQFEYNNGMYLLAGQLVASVGGSSYAEVVRQRLFLPLGMQRTTGPLHEIAQRENVAISHEMVDGQMTPIGLTDQYDAGGAGLFYSSVAEYSSWLRMWLNEGKLGDQTILKPETVKMAFTPHMVVQQTLYPVALEAGVDLVSYGLGWFLHEYRGRRVNMHTGSIDGMSAIVGLMPEEKVGVVAFINADHIELRHALMYETFDRAIGGEQRDWSEDLHELYGSIAEAAEKRRSQRLAGLDSSAEAVLPLSAYAGVFRHKLFGEQQVRFEDGRLRISPSPLMNFDLKAAGGHRFLAYPIRRGFENAPDARKYGDPMLVEFEVGGDNRPCRLRMFGNEFERANRGRQEQTQD